ncbi:MAG: helix-turn-helix domain-containing protein [Oscillospiraceae bacterium]|jgi:transcriptional regulator with XRE-family HTH domain|nr:helix-turn-helix domain-containing protein [Oscillospiraceae bacterium]
MTKGSRTAEVMRKIITAKTVTKMLKATDEEPTLPPIGVYLDDLRKEKGLKKEEFFALSGVSAGYGYEIFRGVKSPSRDTLIQFAFALGLDVDQTNDLLKIGEKAQLYPKMKRDALIIYALSCSFTIIKLNILADENGILPIGNY